ncbi:helix-turn-helix domain-containing protein [Bacillus safensis]|uniref:helix-turn-helix domain-containing protein n=1 Tax=Bacillus safensis TaxID=561879 RepID=UPI001CD54916|nr:helix-turn-helix domain-containing protein [Bacillus safensis]
MTEYYILQPLDKRKFIETEVLLTSEAIEFLGISQARMSALIKTGKITPVKKSGASIYFC